MIVIGGVPGTGKTSVANALGKMLKLKVVHLSELAKNIAVEFSKEWDAFIVDINKVNVKGNVILEGHLTCEKRFDDKIFVLRTNPDVLEKRLKERNYSKNKIEENVMAEMLDYCSQRAGLFYDKVYEIDTSNRNAKETAQKLINILKGIETSDSVDWKDELIKRVVNDM